VVQWQDSDLTTYPEAGPNYALLELFDPLPEEFDPAAPSPGFWVVDGALSRVPPPPTLAELAISLQAAVQAAAMGVLGSAIYAGVAFATVTDARFSQLLPVAISPDDFPSLSTVSFQQGSPLEWVSLSKADLRTAVLAFTALREACEANRHAHAIAIEALVTANNRPGLVAYDVNTGWPTV
jgi:hypothetical protein